MSKYDGGPAFARASDSGMSLRDWFAGMALSGLIAQCEPPAIDGLSHDDFAACAYEMADAMIAALADTLASERETGESTTNVGVDCG